MVPEFAMFLEETPQVDRTGNVFSAPPLRGDSRSLCVNNASKVISAIGHRAGVMVSQKGDKTKYASAHDFRRAFGLRWSDRVMPKVLQQMMRHEDIQTTMKFYVGKNAQAAADAICLAATNTSTNTQPESAPHRIS